MRIALPSLSLLALALPLGAQVPCGLTGVTVTLSPDSALPGQPILVTLTNNSNQLIQLPTSCTYQSIHAGNTCAGGLVFGPFCLQVITPINVGQSHSMFWDQLDQNGLQVPDGEYSVSMFYYDSNFVPFNCCPTLTISSEPGTAYCFGDGSDGPCPCGNSGSGGEGCANSTNSGALFTASGDALVGADTVVFSVVQGPPNVPGLFFSGPLQTPNQPFGDGFLCIGGPLRRLGIVFTDGAGSAQSPWTVSVLEGLSGGELRHYQYWYRNVSGPCNGGFNTSNAYSIQW
jgi:hypothetical protein